MHGVEVVAQRGPRHRLPAVVARQRVDLRAANSAEPEPLGEHATCTCATTTASTSSRLAISTTSRAAYAERQHRDRRRRGPPGRPRSSRPSRRARRTPPPATPVRISGSACTTFSMSVPKCSTVASESIGGRRLLTIQRVARSIRVRTDEPHVGLHVGVDLVVERVDPLDQVVRAVDLAADEVRPRQLLGAGARLLAEPVEERDAGEVDQVVDDLGHDDLAPQRMLLHLRRGSPAACCVGK